MSLSPTEFGSCPEFHSIDPASIRGRVLGNFFRTFWYAQGDQPLDINLTTLLAYQYRHFWGPETQDELSNLGPLTPDDRVNLRLPHRHSNPGKGSVRGEFEDRWELFNKRLTNPNFAGAVANNDEVAKVVKMVGTLLIKQDIYFGDNGRRFSTCNDPYESMYRTFVLQQRDAGSPEFNWIFSQVHELHQTDGAPDRFVVLERKWSLTHPNEAFASPSPTPA